MQNRQDDICPYKWATSSTGPYYSDFINPTRTKLNKPFPVVKS